MAASALQQNLNTAGSLSSILSTLFGSPSTTATTTKTGGTTTGTVTDTKQTNVSDAGIQALIKQMLEDQSTGLAKVASGSKVAGLYNSSSQQLLVNDLLARAAANAEIARSPTTTTQAKSETTPTSTTTTDTKSAGLVGTNATASNLALPALALGVLMKKDEQGKSGFSSLSEAISGAFGNDSASASNAPLASVGSSVADITGSSAASFLTGAATPEMSIAPASSVIDTIGSLVASGSSDIIGDLLSSLGTSTATDVATNIATDVAEETAPSVFEGISDFFSDWF